MLKIVLGTPNGFNASDSRGVTVKLFIDKRGFLDDHPSSPQTLNLMNRNAEALRTHCTFRYKAIGQGSRYGYSTSNYYGNGSYPQSVTRFLSLRTSYILEREANYIVTETGTVKSLMKIVLDLHPRSHSSQELRFHNRQKLSPPVMKHYFSPYL